MNTSDAIRTMRAVRAFTDQSVPEEMIRAIVNAGRRAQSSKNTQPWQFVVVREKEALKQLSECGMFAQHLAGAAFAVALISPNPTASIWARRRRLCSCKRGSWALARASPRSTSRSAPRASWAFPLNCILTSASRLAIPTRRSSLRRPGQAGASHSVKWCIGKSGEAHQRGQKGQTKRQAANPCRQGFAARSLLERKGKRVGWRRNRPLLL